VKEWRETSNWCRERPDTFEAMAFPENDRQAGINHQQYLFLENLCENLPAGRTFEIDRKDVFSLSKKQIDEITQKYCAEYTTNEYNNLLIRFDKNGYVGR
jgi:hypothetical protein